MATDATFTIRQVAPARTEEPIESGDNLPTRETAEPHEEEGVSKRNPRRATTRRKKKEKETKEKTRKPPGKLNCYTCITSKLCGLVICVCLSVNM